MDPGEFPTLEEAASMAGGGKRPTPSVYFGATDAEVEDISMEAEEDAILMAAAEQFEKIVEPVEEPPAVPPLLESELGETPDWVKEGLQQFGHKAFRGGQEEAVMRILAGKSTVVLLATGSGKSVRREAELHHHRHLASRVPDGGSGHGAAALPAGRLPPLQLAQEGEGEGGGASQDGEASFSSGVSRGGGRGRRDVRAAHPSPAFHVCLKLAYLRLAKVCPSNIL